MRLSAALCGTMLFIIVVLAVSFVEVVFVTLYPFVLKAFFNLSNDSDDPEPFNISIFILDASVFETLLLVVFVELLSVSVSSSDSLLLLYNSLINFAVSFLSGIKNHNG